MQASWKNGAQKCHVKPSMAQLVQKVHGQYSQHTCQACCKTNQILQGCLTTVNTLGTPGVFAMGGMFAIASSEHTAAQAMGPQKLFIIGTIFTMAGFAVARDHCTSILHTAMWHTAY